MSADDVRPRAELLAELDPAADPTEMFADLAGANPITRDLLLFAWEGRYAVTSPAQFSWNRMLGHVPEGVRGAVDNFLHLCSYLRGWEQPHDLAVDMKLRYSIVEMLWRLQHAADPCLSSVAVADTVDEVHPCDGLLCGDCRRAVA